MNVLIFTDTNGALGFGRYAGPYRVATELRKAGFTTQVIEFFAEISQEELLKIIDKFVGDDTLWVGFSTTLMVPEVTCEYIRDKILKGEYNNSFMIENWRAGVWPRNDRQMWEMYHKIKNINPNTKIVLGGSKSVRPLNNSPIPVDFFVWGEADLSAVELSKHIAFGHSIKTDTFNNTTRLIGEDYPVGPMKDKIIEWHDNDKIFPHEVLPIELSRGCIFKCSYCSFKNLGRKGDTTYLKDIDVFRQEVIHNYERFGTQRYMFSDDTFNDSPAKVEMYADCIDSLPFEFGWAGYCRVDTLATGDKIIYNLKRTRPDFINFGIETFCRKAGQAVGKGMDPERVKDTLYRTKEILGDKTTISCNFIAGLRYETEEDIWRTVEWLTSPDCPVDAFNFTPLYLLHYRRDVMDKTSDFSNEIGNNPEKFGYEYNPETSYWKHETMDSTRAHQIVNEIYKLQEAQTKTLANRIGFFGRLQNLGLTLQDLKTISPTNEKPVLDIVTRKINLKNQYVKRLLNE